MSKVSTPTDEWTPTPLDIPSYWEQIDFEDVFENISLVSRKVPQKDYLPSGTIPIVDQGTDLIGGFTNDESKGIQSTRQLIIFGDHTKCIKLVGFRFAPGADGIKVLKPILIDERFAFYACRALQLPDRGYSRHYSFLKKSKIPLAPHNEQRRIVAKIEQLFSEIDKGIESLKTVRAKLDVYRQAVLKHAFEGKLTARWREENIGKLETPEQLLARIKQEREARYEQQLTEWKAAVETWDVEGRSGKKPSKPKKLVHSHPLAAEDVLALPKLSDYWSWFLLSSIASNIQIGPFGSLLHKADYIVGGTPLVNPSHIRFQRIEPDQTLTVSADKLHQLGKYVMHENDIVIGRRGEMGRCAVVTAGEAGWLCGTGSLFVRLLSSMNPHFYSWVLGSQRVKHFLAASSIGTTMQNLNESILHSVPVPVCSRQEQDEVFREVKRQYSTLDHIEAALDSEITKSAALRQSILKQAFSGQLVAQDPNDEPASVLLDRISGEREKAAKNNHSKKTKKRKAIA